jgi:hypothetical protein
MNIPFDVLLCCFLLVWILLGLYFVFLIYKTIRRKPGTSIAARWLILVFSIGISCFTILPACPLSPRNVGYRRSCISTLRQIGTALQGYHDFYRAFPPAYVADKNGRPLYSWRVLILPFMDQEHLYKNINLNEPWDSPHNKPILDSSSYAFLCPNLPDENELDTSYVMIVGPDTISDGPHSSSLHDFQDGASNTIFAVEIANSGIHWAEPRDLKADEINYRINDPDHKGISSCHKGYAHVLFGDNTVREMKDSTDPEIVKAMTTIAGGEKKIVEKFFRQEYKQK